MASMQITPQSAFLREITRQPLVRVPLLIETLTVDRQNAVLFMSNGQIMPVPDNGKLYRLMTAAGR